MRNDPYGLLYTAAVSSRSKRAKAPADDDSSLTYDADWKYVGDKTSKGLYPLMILTGSGNKGSKKIAGFDLDCTLIVTKSGRIFGKGPSDWKLMDKVKDKLISFHKEGFKVVIFTNQRGFEKGHGTQKNFDKKITAIINELGVPIQVFVATGENHYRKPSTAMWDYMVDHENDNITPDMKASYYVGDAAGRPKDWAPGKVRDFSCSDRKFTANVGIKFYTPEEFFLGEKPVPFDWRSCDPSQILQETKGDSLKDSYHSKNKDLILMVGPPASGKSSFSHRYLVPHGYVRVNRDTLQTPAKCLAATKTAIKEGKNVVIDNTNPSKAARADYIRAAKEAAVDCELQLGWPVQDRMHIDSGSYHTMVSLDKQFTCDGHVTQWRFQAKASNPLLAIVWRAVEGSDTQFKIVGINEIPAGEINTPVTYTVPLNERIAVTAGDMMGWSFGLSSLAWNSGGNTRVRLGFGVHANLAVEQIADINFGVQNREYSIEATLKPFGDYTIRCFNMTTSLDVAHHLNYVRQVQTLGKKRRVPDVGYNVYKKNHEKPDKKEGFDDILDIPFVPHFDSDSDKELFLKWTTG